MTTLAPNLSDAPTQVGGRLPLISQRDRRRAALTAEHLGAGRYLAIEDGEEIVVIPVGEGSLRLGRGFRYGTKAGERPGLRAS
jgi:hypothetical protein